MRNVARLFPLVFVIAATACACPRAIAVASFSRSAWQAFVDKASRDGASWEETSREATRLGLLRGSDRDFAESLLGKAYERAYRAKSPAQAGILAPRRVMDCLVSAAAEAHDIFKMTSDPQTALDRYFTRVRALIGGTAPSPLDRYSAKDVLAVARALQKEMANLGSRLPRNAPLDLYGSFPNGRADLTCSDLDLRTHQIAVLTPLWVYGYRAVHDYFSKRSENVDLRFAFSTTFADGLGEAEIA